VALSAPRNTFDRRGTDLDSDWQLVTAVADGSTDALGRLYDRHAATVYALARRIVSRLEDAEEVVQDVFAQVWRQAHQYRNERASVAGWIVMLARTRAIDRLRARRARPDEDRGVDPATSMPMPASGPSPEQAALSADDVARVRQALAGLADNQRSLLELAYYEGLTHTEIAAKTGIPLGTVKTRIRSGMDSLRGVLKA
jgi:RNA polymerase sigma-70 factor (ECF subfamily)